MKDKIEVGMLSPLMAEFIPDYSDIVNLDDAEPLEGPDLVQYQTSIAEKVDEINRLGMPDNQPCNLIDYFDQNKDIKEKVERITMAVKEQEGVLYGCANLTLRENLTPEEYRVVGQYLRGQYSDGWGESLEQREIKVDGGELYLHFYVGAGSDFQIQVKAPENGVQEKQPEQKPSRPELKLLGHDGNISQPLGMPQDCLDVPGCPNRPTKWRIVSTRAAITMKRWESSANTWKPSCRTTVNSPERQEKKH